MSCYYRYINEEDRNPAKIHFFNYKEFIIYSIYDELEAKGINIFKSLSEKYGVLEDGTQRKITPNTLNKVIKTLEKIGISVDSFSIIRIGEEYDDIVKLQYNGKEVTEAKAKIVWDAS